VTTERDSLSPGGEFFAIRPVVKISPLSSGVVVIGSSRSFLFSGLATGHFINDEALNCQTLFLPLFRFVHITPGIKITGITFSGGLRQTAT